jgi:uncharacterized OB-fold protein
VSRTPQLVRGAVYRPSWNLDGLPAAGPDEDGFTMAATALERLYADPPAGPAPRTIHLVGDAPEVASWGLAAVAGSPLEVVRHGAGVAGFRAAWAAVGEARSILIAVDLPERAEGGAASMDTCAVALLLDPGRDPAPTPLHESWRATQMALALRPADVATGVWTESSIARPELILDPRRLREFVETPTRTVAEGAYVPRPRYLESLASRWRLVAERCGHCSGVTFPARGACVHCGRREGLLRWALPIDQGRVVASTVIGPGGQPTEFDAQVASFGAYGVALVDLAPGARATLPVTDAATPLLPIGAPVVTYLRRLYPMEGEWRYGRKAAPAPTRSR